ncbi:MAG TPA: lipoprotein [Dokdonella sp.]|nr:sugar transporter [Dokdonella sp.]HOX72484.1 lipoprotein [Dokdonella sp.]HPG92995.1 lipoprotein [Dokdonella sp.]HPN79616.1 lipoprotein [Dokdonella sp.]
MPRKSRLLPVLGLLILLAACGNKGELVKPAPPTDTAKTSTQP